MPRPALLIVHDPPGYRMELRVSDFADRDVLADRHVVVRTGDLQAIALDEQEVKLVIEWLQEWLNEEKGV